MSEQLDRLPVAGDEVEVEHSCRALDGRSFEHVALVSVQHVVRLNDGTFRVEGTRCDGSPVHFRVDRDGREVPARSLLGEQVPA